MNPNHSMTRSVPNGQPPAIRELLEDFRLSHSAHAWEDIVQSATRDNLSYHDFLIRMLSDEASLKHSKTVERLVREARFPTVKTPDSFDWAHPEKIDKQLVLRALDLDFVGKGENLIFVGPSGLGKSHLATAIGYAACQKEIKTLFTTAADMINSLVAAHADHSLEKTLRKYCHPRLLILDELGYLPLDKEGRDLFFQVISKRYETGSIVLTTNRAFKDWPEIFGDSTATAAIVDRLTHHAELVRIAGRSYRAEKRRKTAE